MCYKITQMVQQDVDEIPLSVRYSPLTMKLPVVRYSPVGAVLDTWWWYTHQALVTTLASHAALLHIAIVPASFRVLGGTSSPVGFFRIQLLAPWRSAWTYRSPAVKKHVKFRVHVTQNEMVLVLSLIQSYDLLCNDFSWFVRINLQLLHEIWL